MVKKKKPTVLQPGSTIAIISPSTGLPHLLPDIYELGLRHLQETFKLNVVEMPTARMHPDELYKHPELRAADIHQGLLDPAIDGILCSIGGYESIRILPHLDPEIIINHPKLIMGFSDATTFLSYFNQLGLVTFYGPSVMAGMAQISHLPSAYLDHLKAMLFGTSYPYVYKPYEQWTQGYKDWSILETLGECQPFQSNEGGWSFLQGHSVVSGELWGGCIEVLEFMKGTSYWPSPDFWQEKILFFETSEEKPSPMQVGYMLRNYGMQGILSKIKGIMLGRPKDYTEEETMELHRILQQIIRDEFKEPELPIVVQVDFGHTDPKIVLPLGCQVELDPAQASIVLLESPFCDVATIQQ